MASVAIAAYEEVKYNVDGIPVLLTALEEDTANLRSSFENIPACIRRFEEVYGDHTFDRIGFNIVPFNSGAMEHATNIAYPRYAIANGGKQNETLYAHELAHHWWGNTTTCGTQEDMWLNEGWASYSERIFLEAVYGREAYNEDIEANHKRVLQFAHIQDGDVLPVSGIGHSNTYGRHVYNKGADMVHSLRGMMGDDGFFEACGSFQQRYKLQDVSTDDMKAHFQKYTSLDLTGFFEQWIKEAGFAHMDIVQAYKQADRYHLRIKQTPRFNELVYTNLKVQLTAFAADRSRWDTTIVIDQAQQDIVANCPLDAVYWSLDFDDKISDATTTDWAIVSDTTIAKWNYGMMSNIVVDAPSADSMLLHITHHWAPADGTYGVPVGARLSRERYWSVGGVWQDETVVSAEIAYNGLTSTQQEFGYLDTDLIRITEDSLVLLYRSHASAEWQVADNYTKTMGSLFDKRGTIQINNLKQGQYALAMYDAQLATVKAPEKSAAKYKVYPNPTDNVLIISFNDKPTTGIVEITDSLGKVVLKEQLNEVSETYLIDVSGLVPGTYFVGVVIDQQAYNLQKIVVK